VLKIRRQLARRLLLTRTLAIGLMLLSSSCSSTRSLDTSVNSQSPASTVHADYQVDQPTTKVRGQDGASETHQIVAPKKIVQLSQETDGPAFPVGRASISLSAPTEINPFEVIQSDLPSDPVSRIEEESSSNGVYQTAFFPASARVPLKTVAGSQPHCPQPSTTPCEVVLPLYEPDYYPDEYICDGGDRGIKVYHDEFGRQGLETEDTVAEFTDDAGHRRIRPSCRTCIYAPQFAAVRSASLPEVSLTVGRAAGTHDRRRTIGLRSQLTPETELQNDQPIGVNTRSRASGMDRLLSQNELDQIARLARHIKLINAFEDRLFLQRGQLDRTEEAYLAQEVQLAATWTRDLNPVIVASDAGGQEVIAEFTVEEYVGIEDKSTPGDLKIIKLVDKPTALPGDIVTFTIHYENIGDRSLYRINIVDNLTPRLEFIDGTTDSDRKGVFTVEPNGEGSVIVTFELTDPLPGLTGGTLTFQCRVH